MQYIYPSVGLFVYQRLPIKSYTPPIRGHMTHSIRTRLLFPPHAQRCRVAIATDHARVLTPKRMTSGAVRLEVGQMLEIQGCDGMGRGWRWVGPLVSDAGGTREGHRQ